MLFGFFAANVIAWQQAWTMTHYVRSGTAPPTIEAMSWPEKARAIFQGLAVARPANVHTPRDVGLDYSVNRVAFPYGSFVESWIVERPQARGVILLFPGYASSKESLLAPAARLSSLGYAVVLTDFRGAGGSSGDDTTLGVRESSDVAAVFADAQRRWPTRPLILYGVSMGSAAILHAVAVEGIRPAAVILESPFDRLLGTVSARFRAFGLPRRRQRRNSSSSGVACSIGRMASRSIRPTMRDRSPARRSSCTATGTHGRRQRRRPLCTRNWAARSGSCRFPMRATNS